MRRSTQVIAVLTALLPLLVGCHDESSTGPTRSYRPAFSLQGALPGLVSRWSAEGNANDAQGGNDGTLENGATFAPGQVGQAFLLDGIDDYVDVGNAANLQVSAGDFTIDTWVLFNALGHPPGANLGAPQGDMSIMDKMSASGTNADGWRLIKQNDNRFWFCFGGGSNHCADPAYTIFSGSGVSTGVWYHVAVVKNSSSFSLYVNGVLQDSRSVPGFLDTQAASLRLGSYSLEGSHLNGEIDEAEIYNRALSADEISGLYHQGLPLFRTDFGSPPCNTALAAPEWFGKDGASTPFSGTLAVDPLNPNNCVLTFTQLTAAGDAFGPLLTATPGQTYLLEFDYLGTPGQGGVDNDLGGTIGISNGFPDTHRWMAGTTVGSGIEQDLLVDDGQWRHYSIPFDPFQTTGFSYVGTGAFHVMLEDFSGSGGVPHDAYFDNIVVRVANLASQTITFGPLGDRTFGDPPFTISASASSGLPVSFTATGNCSVSQNSVTLTGAGTCTITADQVGNGSVNPAPSVAQTFSIAKATPLISWSPPASMVYGQTIGGAQLNATATGVGGVSLSGAFAYTPPAGTILSPGSQTLGVSFTPEDQTNYLGATKTGSIAVLYNTAVGHSFLQPINVPPQAQSVFKIGSTIPAKFQLFLADGVTPLSTAIATIQVNKVSSGVPSSVNETVTSTVPNQGVSFRYDPTSQQYIFNLGTKGWTAGNYQIVANLDDGSQLTVIIGVR